MSNSNSGLSQIKSDASFNSRVMSASYLKELNSFRLAIFWFKKGSSREGYKKSGIVLDEGGTGEGLSDKGLSGEGTSGEGTSDKGTSDEGTSDKGTSGEGLSGEGTSGEGLSGEGTSGEGTSDKGTSGEGLSDKGTSGEGTSDKGTSGEGLSDKGTSGDEAFDSGNFGGLYSSAFINSSFFNSFSTVSSFLVKIFINESINPGFFFFVWFLAAAAFLANCLS